MKNAKWSEDQERLARIVSASCRRHIFDPGDREVCALEFAEYVLLFLEEEKRSLLLAYEHERLLRRVAVCFVLTWVQKARLRQSHSVCFTDLPESDLSVLASSGAEVFVATLAAFAAESLHYRILQLPGKQRACAVRRWLEEQSVEDIAVDLRLTPAAVRKNLQYARDSIRKGLKEMGYEGKELL